ncbi:hypothetical protein ACROYT_G002665 [Oculina patagonica]
MNSSNTDLVANASSQVLSEFFCPVKPIYIWALSERTLFKIATATTIVISSVAILLNILVILAVKLRRELKEHHSNILLSSLAVADVLMGAVAMPLTICLDVLVLLKRFLSPDVFCRILFANEMVLNISGTSSLYHLVVIAWERYVAVTKWREYKVIVTRGRVKKYAKVAWLLAVFMSLPPGIMKLVGVQYKYVVVVNKVSFIPAVVCIILISYFYIMTYLGVRKRDINTISEVRSLITVKLATKVAKTTAMLTAAVLISFVPSFVVLFFGEIFPVLRRSSFFRWAMVLTQLNSVINPVLYCYRDRRYRDAMLKMLKMKKTAAGVQKNVNRIGSVQSVEDVPKNNHTPRSRTRSCGSIPNLRDTDQRRKHGQLEQGRRTSAPSRETIRVICVDIHQPKIIATKSGFQIESGVTNESRSHLKVTSGKPHASRIHASAQLQSSSLPLKDPRHHYREPVRSKSLNERALFEMISSQHNSCQEAIRRPNAAPSTARSKKLPERKLTGFTRKTGIKLKSGLTGIGRRSHLKDTNDQLQAARLQASLKLQSSSLRPDGSRHHHREMVRSKSLDERALCAMIDSQHKSWPEAARRPKTGPSTARSKKMPVHKLTGFTRKPGIKGKSGLTGIGRRSHLKDTNDQLQASRLQASLKLQSSSLRTDGSRHHDREMVRSKSLNERALFELIGSQHKSCQEAIRRPNTAPSTARSKKVPERELIGFTRNPGIKLKSGLKRIGRRSHFEDTNDQLQDSRLQALVQLQSSSFRPKGSRHQQREMVRSKSLDKRALFEMIGSQHKSWPEATRRPKTGPSTARSKKMPEHKLTSFTRKQGIKLKSGLTRNGRRSHFEDTNDQFQESRFQSSLQPQSSSLRPDGSRHHQRSDKKTKDSAINVQNGESART